jgi:hypothetical protein
MSLKIFCGSPLNSFGVLSGWSQRIENAFLPANILNKEGGGSRIEQGLVSKRGDRVQELVFWPETAKPIVRHVLKHCPDA